MSRFYPCGLPVFGLHRRSCGSPVLVLSCIAVRVSGASWWREVVSGTSAGHVGGAWAEWRIVASLDVMSEEKQDDLLMSVEQLWEEDYDSALVDDGWSDDGTSTEIQCEISLKECDERGFVLAEFDGH